jgi:hypothetical protein
LAFGCSVDSCLESNSGHSGISKLVQLRLTPSQVKLCNMRATMAGLGSFSGRTLTLSNDNNFLQLYRGCVDKLHLAFESEGWGETACGLFEADDEVQTALPRLQAIVERTSRLHKESMRLKRRWEI